MTLYSGRTEELVAPLIDRFEEATGIDVEVRYGSSPEMAATLLTEGANSPADLFYAQDPASLGSVADLMTPLPDSVLSLVPETFRDPEGLVGRGHGAKQGSCVQPRAGRERTSCPPATGTWSIRSGQAGSESLPPTARSSLSCRPSFSLEGEEAAREWLRGAGRQ